MRHLSINAPSNSLELAKWLLAGKSIAANEKRLKHLVGVFSDNDQFQKMNPDTLVYSVQCHMPVPEGTSGGLFFGTTTVQPGRVGDEYFMTRGHLHLKLDRGEYYWGVQGEGMLVMMNGNRETWAEKMYPGSLHYIDGGIAHRVANVGGGALIFAASWPSDAGHNYEEIARSGFSARLRELGGKPTLVAE
jgi:glucose-6-phosphate isomerase, archaeal